MASSGRAREDSRLLPEALSIAHVGGTRSDADRDRELAVRHWLACVDPQLAGALSASRHAGRLDEHWIDLNPPSARDFLRERAAHTLVITHHLWSPPSPTQAARSGPTACSPLHEPAHWRRRLRETGASYIFMFGPHFHAGSLDEQLDGYVARPIAASAPASVFIRADHAGRCADVADPALGPRQMAALRRAALPELHASHSLDLCYTQLCDTDIEALRAMPQLQQLWLVGVDATDAQLARVLGVGALKSLSLANTQAHADTLRVLGRQAELEKLALDFTPLSDALLTQVAGFRALRWLSLVGTNVGDEGIARLEPLSRLAYLSLARTRVSARGVAALQRALPRCSIVAPQVGADA